MGRYYQGDIEGKFWFGVQESTDAEHFGAQENTNYIQYTILNEDKDTEVQAGIERCITELGTWKEGLDAFFESRNSYSNEYIVDFWKEEYKETVSLEDVRNKLEIYARLALGRQIEKFFKEFPDDNCYFEAEL
jgi:hypothetical protein